METKIKVRRRRQERIRLLQSAPQLPADSPLPARPEAGIEADEPAGRKQPPAVMPAAPERRSHIALPPVPDLKDERWQDPEFVWKQREMWMRQWHAQPGPDQPPDDDDDDGRNRSWRFVPTRRQLVAKFVVSVILFALVWAMFQTKLPWAASGQQLVRTALTEDWQFPALSAWYRDNFSGYPSFIPAFPSHGGEATKVNARKAGSFLTPLVGEIAASYSSVHPWIAIRTSGRSTVTAADTGRVTFAGVRADSGYTVVLQHSGGYETTYGQLQAGEWSRGDWVQAGDPLGSLTGSQLYFAMAKDGSPVNPADVIAFD
ncbi:MAG: M23 family metallopeptidase [Paenibacillaceae bacterium]|nr:M23 family metallopeptidase [Paenibacillaceae bacterium]